MTAEELAEVDNDEALAIEILAKKCEFVGKYYYRELLSHALNKDCLEAQIVSYCDKMDGFCEALHEIYAGNGNFRRPAVNYVRRINEFDKKYPLLEKMFTLNHVLVQFPQTFDVDKVISEGKLHTVDSILLNTASPHYEVWKKITVENLGMNVLINKIE